MNILENVKMALSSIWANKMRSFLTMLGIIIGISSVIAVVSLGQGGQHTITGEFEKIGTNTVAINVNENNAEQSDYITFEDVRQLKEKIPYIRYATQIVRVQGWASYGTNTKMAIVVGGSGDMFRIENNEILYGRIFTDIEYEEGKAVAVIDSTTAKKLFRMEDAVGMTMDVGPKTAQKSVTIVGVIKSAYDMFAEMTDNDYIPVVVHMPATTVSHVFSLDETASQVFIMADNKENVESAGNLAVNLLENRHGNRGRDAYKAENLMKQLDQINTVVGIFTTFVAVVAAISLVVGGVGVMNIMLVSVTERTREIGIRKAIGARTGHILFQFLTESVIISCIGGILGLIFGIFGAYGLGRLAGITPHLSPGTVILAILFSSAVGIFFGIYPARKAAMLDPIEALRYE
ncbi:MAG: FtsX-like permease family protein [Clostridiaceae bacterium]|nr:FtsX-like permease family protein [Clostridiaceae bacterium]